MERAACLTCQSLFTIVRQPKSVIAVGVCIVVGMMAVCDIALPHGVRIADALEC
jgi:hypothetical protein